jgi:release factor glutamine methyltransferase
LSKTEDRRRFGNKNKQAYFVFLSTCTIFVGNMPKMRDTTTYIKQTLADIYPPEEIRGFTRLIFSYICNLSYNQQILCKDKQIPENEKKRICAILNRLKKQEPIQYIIGETEFYSFPMKVNPSVLIPRPETEELVDLIIKSSQVKRYAENALPRHPPSKAFLLPSTSEPPHGKRLSDVSRIKILDIGTGSGCIAIALAGHIPSAEVTAIDNSKPALQTAMTNARLNKTDIRFLQSDILNIDQAASLISGAFDLIVSNPPYVKNSEQCAMSPNVLDYEPHCALFVPDEDPLLFYRAIIAFAQKKFTPGGLLYFEINPECDTLIAEMLYNNGFTHTEIIRDLSGKNRFVIAKKKRNENRI